MRWAFTRSSETVKQPVLFYALVWFSHARGPDTLIGGGKSPFHPRSRCSVSAWVLDLLKKKGWFTGEKVSFLWSTIYPANFDTFNGLLELVPSGISPFLVFFWPNEMISYWTLCSLRSTSYKIIVPHTQLAIKWFIQMTKTLKTLFFFICYHPFPRQPAVKVQSFEPKGWGYSEGGQIKTNFSLFSFVYVCQCVRSSSGRVKQYRRLLLLFVCFFFFWKSVGIRDFLLIQCKSGSLYFLHKLLNETAYLRSTKSPGVGITAFFVCPMVGNRPTSER